MGVVARESRRQPAVVARQRGRRRRIHCNPLRRPSENNHAGQQDRLPQQIVHDNPGQRPRAEYRRMKRGVKEAEPVSCSLNRENFAMLQCTEHSRDAHMHEAPVLRPLFISFLLISTLVILDPTKTCASSFEHLTDLTGKVNAIVTLKGRDNFTSEYRYDVSVRNHSPDLIVADSLVIVLDKITNLGGEDHEALKNDSLLSRFDVLGQDGETDDGKAFFRIPVGAAPDLGPQTDSLPAAVRIRNKDYMAVFTPGFRVYGIKRPPPEPTRRIDTPTPPTVTPALAPASRNAVDKLIQLLIKKGVLTEEEWRKANQP